MLWRWLQRLIPRGRSLRALELMGSRLAAGDFGARCGIDLEGRYGRLARRLNAVARRQGRITREKNLALDILSAQRDDLRRTVLGLQTQLHAARAEAEEARAARAELLNRLAHAASGPVDALFQISGQALKHGLAEVQFHQLMSLHGEADALRGLIGDLRDFSAIETHQLMLDTRPFELRPLVEELFERVSDEVQTRGLMLTLSLPPDLPGALVGDPDRLVQALQYLCKHAIETTRRGEVLFELDMTDRRPSSVRLQFQLRDTGVGLRREQRKRVFEPFALTDSLNGLGLAISRQLVHLMGGELAVESALGRGSRFHFTLRFPLQTRPLAEPPPPVELPSSMAPAPTPRGNVCGTARATWRT